MNKIKGFFEKLLEQADIRINGDRPWDIQVHNERLYRRILAQGSMGLGESYMEGWWDSAAIDQMIDRAFKTKIDKKILFNWHILLSYLSSNLFNLQSGRRSYEVGKRHYDVGNDLYQKMLDKRMCYSCGYWKDANSLDEAQEAKLDLICRKLGLQPGMRVLDIGSGWGSFLKFAADKYGIEGVGLTISKEQASWSSQLVKDLPIEIRLQDYNHLNEKFDRVVSIGMFEHVGYKNYKKFMEVVYRNLSSSGLQMLHTIGSSITKKITDPWIEKYIFPNSMLPSIAQIGKAIEKKFVMEDWHNFGVDYDKTLMAWYKNFIQSWPEIKDKYGERFKRMWTFYLLISAGAFRSRGIQLWQIVLSKDGVPGGYQSLR